MTIERTYKCNLCADRKEIDELIGIDWTHTGFVEKPARETEHHVCLECARAIYDIYVLKPRK